MSAPSGSAEPALEPPAKMLKSAQSVTDPSNPEKPAVSLPNVSICGPKGADKVQSWVSMDIAGIMGARLKASWRHARSCLGASQSHVNQQGAMYARVAALDGTSLIPWRRIGPYPAPRTKTDVDIELPKEFFAGESQIVWLCVESYTNDAIKVPTDDPASLIATAKYGWGDRYEDVTNIVRGEMSVGKSVVANESLLGGNPSWPNCKNLIVTLKEDVDIQFTGPMPKDARLELGFIGGGGGHRLSILNAFLFPEKFTQVLQATCAPPNVTITTMSGEIFATVADVMAEEDGKLCADKICVAVRGILGLRKGFTVFLSGTDQVIASGDSDIQVVYHSTL